MTNRLHARLTPRVELHCAVTGCPWTHQRTDPDARMVTLRPGSPPQLDFNAAFAGAVRRDDDAIRAHLAEHPIEDFLRTIADLRAQLAAAENKGRGPLPT